MPATIQIYIPDEEFIKFKLLDKEQQKKLKDEFIEFIRNKKE